MCHFISATLPAGVDLAALSAVVAPMQLALTPYANASLAGWLRAGERLVTTTTGPCDCGTALGSGARLARDRQHVAEPTDAAAAAPPAVARLAKKGWSAAKIARWLEQQAQTAARDDRVALDRRAAHATSGTADLERWCAALGALLDGGLPWVGLLLHDYDGALTTERITVAAEVEVARAELTPARLLDLAEDTLYRFVADRVG